MTRARRFLGSSLDLELDTLVRSLGRSAIREVLGPLREDEREEQKRLEAELKGLKPKKEKSEADEGKDELEEAEDDEDSAGDDSIGTESGSRSKVVSKKMAIGKPEPEAPKAVIPDPSDVKDVTFDQVITLMNMMRSGRSSKEPRTKQSLQDYFKGLNSGERQALFVLLSGLTQIIAGGVEGDAAPDPAEVGITIRPRRADTDTRAPTKGVTRDPALAKPTKSDAAAGPVPIVVGETADRSRERRVLEGLRGSRK